MPRGVARGHEATRAALRQGAAAYFARTGYDRAPMTGAARECGVSTAVIAPDYDSQPTQLSDILTDPLSVSAHLDTSPPHGAPHAIITPLLDEYSAAVP